MLSMKVCEAHPTHLCADVTSVCVCVSTSAPWDATCAPWSMSGWVGVKVERAFVLTVCAHVHMVIEAGA
jgi:hypothetical protein